MTRTDEEPDEFRRLFLGIRERSLPDDATFAETLARRGLGSVAGVGDDRSIDDSRRSGGSRVRTLSSRRGMRVSVARYRHRQSEWRRRSTFTSLVEAASGSVYGFTLSAYCSANRPSSSEAFRGNRVVELAVAADRAQQVLALHPAFQPADACR